MPKNPNTIQFSLPTQLIERLRDLAYNGESVGLVAKRILIESIDSPIDKPIGKSIDSSIDKNLLNDLVARVRSLEQKLETHDAIAIEKIIDTERDLPQIEVDFDEVNAASFWSGKTTVDPDPLHPESKALKKGYLIYWDKDLGDLRLWTGREWATDLSKAKIVETEKSAIASVRRLKKNGHARSAYEHLGVIYDRLPDEKRLVANTYWCE